MLACQDTCQDILILVPLCMSWYHLTSHVIQFESQRPQLRGSVMRLSSATQAAAEYRATWNTPHRIEAGRGAVVVVEILMWKRKVAGKRSEGTPLSV
jgi:hypothetical protein